ncbi:MAG TPA: hypothetical protein V6D22_12200 [Candidatus Obscuribacterales bacterium]
MARVRILVIRDYSGPTRQLEQYLSLYHDVVGVESKNDALRILQRQHFDIVIMRVNQYERSAQFFIHTIKTKPSLQDVSLICFCAHGGRRTATEDHTIAQHCLAAGADTYTVCDCSIHFP